MLLPCHQPLGKLDMHRLAFQKRSTHVNRASAICIAVRAACRTANRPKNVRGLEITSFMHSYKYTCMYIPSKHEIDEIYVLRHSREQPKLHLADRIFRFSLAIFLS